MKIQFKFLLLIIIFSMLSFCSKYNEDLLDTVKSNTKLVVELKDTYRAFRINDIIIEQKEIINLFADESSDTELKELLEKNIKVCDSLKAVKFNNNILNSHVSKYLIKTIENYRILKNKGFDSAEFKKDFEEYKKAKSEYTNYLYSNYSTNHFVNMTEEKYWKTNNKSNYIKSSDYATYKNLKATKPKEASILLENISQQTTDFQEYSIYQIELADQLVKKNDKSNEGTYEVAIDKYKEILNKKKYSIYLFEAWLKWRLVNQQHIYGISKTSDIPNNEYDKMREKVALTILEYVSKNEKDEMAINEFLLIATHDIVKRFGDYPYGNQNTVEYHQTFDE